MRVLFTTFCLEKAGSHVVALTLASGIAQQHATFFFNQGEQLVDQGMVDRYLSPKVKLVDMNSYPLINKLAWKLNSMLQRLTGYKGFHEACKTMMFLYTIVRYKIDVVHSHEILTKQSRLNAVLRFLSVPVIVTDHSGYTMLRKVQDASFVPYANKAQAIVAVSEYAANTLRHGDQSGMSEQARALGQRIIASDYHTEAEALKHQQPAIGQDEPLTVPVITIYNGVLRHDEVLPPPEAIHRELGIAPGSFVFGMGGRGTEQKGWRHALAAYQQLKHRHPDRKFAWLCMGEGPCLTAMQQELGDTAPDIVFLGNVQNPHYYMSACQVGLVPSSFNEGLPLTIVEFYEHQVPVIASDLCGIPEVIAPADHEPGGLLIEMEEDSTPQIASLLAKMEAYVVNPSLREKHAQATLSIRKRFDVNEFVQAHEHLYSKVLSSSK